MRVGCTEGGRVCVVRLGFLTVCQKSGFFIDEIVMNILTSRRL